jgi:hypothetical protein
VNESVRLAPGESAAPVDPKAINTNIYRGAMWELATIGKPIPAVVMGVLLALLLVFAVVGMPWPSIIFSAVLVGVAIWSQRNVLRWADEHNARVAPLANARPKPGATTTPGAKRPRPAASKSANAKRDRRRP